MNKIKEYTKKVFENIKHIDENGNEYWYARELMAVLEYKEWRKFNKVIQKAMQACNGSNYYVLDHFVLKDKMISIAKGAQRKILDYILSRYACYLIVQNECNDSYRQTVLAIFTFITSISEMIICTITSVVFKTISLGHSYIVLGMFGLTIILIIVLFSV